MELTRREFLKLLGITTASAAVGSLGASTLISVPDRVFERVITGPRIETWKNSICSLCPAGCGIRVRLIDGIPVRVLGNPLYPVNRGAVCPLAEAAIEDLFHPNRVQQPLKRVGLRGENRWEPIPWDEALETLTSRLQQLRQDGTPERFALITRNHNDLAGDLAARFLQAYGSPNDLVADDFRLLALPVQLSQQFDRVPAYDLAHTDYVLNFGADVLDEGPAPVRFNQLYAQLKNREENRPGTIVHLSSYMSRTAIQSSRWVPVNPGTLGALALSIAFVLIKDESYDRDFISRHATGFEDWRDASGNRHKGFKSMVLDEFYPERAAKITGVPAPTILKLARDFAAAPRALALAGSQAAFSSNGMYTAWAVYCLNALKGNFDKEGGVLFSKEMIDPRFPPVKLDSVARKGRKQPALTASEAAGAMKLPLQLPEQALPALASGGPYTIDTLMLYRANPLFESPNAREFEAALKSIPFIVSCTSIIDDTSRHADLILPTPSFLESWNISRTVPGMEFIHMGVQQPMLEPLYDTRDFGDVLLQISEKLGGTVAASLPWSSFVDYLKTYARAIYRSGQGTLVSESVRLSWISLLKKRGWQLFEYSTFEEFWEVLLEKGGWWDPGYEQSGTGRYLKTPSGKFEFISSYLKKEVQRWTRKAEQPQEAFAALKRKLELAGNEDKIYMPHYEPPRFSPSEADFPHHLLTFQQLVNVQGRGGHLALINELNGLYSRQYWHTWAEVNPKTAAKLGVKEDMPIRIISSHGQIVARAKLRPTVMPDTIVVPFGLGHAPSERFKEQIGANPYRIMSVETDPVSGIPSLISTRVRIEKTELVA